MRVNLRLNVENNSKFVRGRKKVKEEIEDYCLRPYTYRKLDKDGREYEVTIPYDDDVDLEKRIHELISHIGHTVDDRHCYVECDVRSVDDPDRTW